MKSIILKEKVLYVFCGPTKSFYDRIPRKVLEWAMMKIGIHEVLV